MSPTPGPVGVIEVVDWSDSPRSPFPHTGMWIDTWTPDGQWAGREFWDFTPPPSGSLFGTVKGALAGGPGVVADAYPGPRLGPDQPESTFYWTTRQQDRAALAEVQRMAAEQAKGNNRFYQYPLSDCADFTRAILDAAGVKEHQRTSGPDRTEYAGPIPAPAPTPTPAPAPGTPAAPAEGPAGQAGGTQPGPGADGSNVPRDKDTRPHSNGMPHDPNVAGAPAPCAACGKDHGHHNFFGLMTCWCGVYNAYMGHPR